MTRSVLALAVMAVLLGCTAGVYAQNDRNSLAKSTGAQSSVYARDNDGKTALMEAATTGNLDRVKALLAAGADVKAKDKSGNTAISLARSRHHASCVKVLSTALLRAKSASSGAKAAPAAKSAFGKANIAESDRTARAESYEKIDPEEFPNLDFRTASSKVVFENGNPVSEDSVVRKFAIGDTDIELTTDSVGIDRLDPHFFTVSTKKFGVVRYEAAFGFKVSIWLTAAQKSDFLKIQQAYSKRGQ